MKTILLLIQAFLIIAAAPLLSGFIRKLKNRIRMRKGAGIFQPYYNLGKLFKKGEVISENTSWIFRLTPFVVLGSTVTALIIVPTFINGISLNRAGDFLAVIFLLGLGRFFLALAALDAGSSFGGMGSSREMFISSLAEPAAVLSIFTVSLNCSSTSLGEISSLASLRVSSLIAAVSLFMITIAETSRIPVDNQETHLELTMVHEAMVLEYSGGSLAVIELASHVKQILFFSILACIVFPFTYAAGGNGLSVLIGLGVYIAKIIVFAVVMALIEVSMTKMRLFRVVDFLVFSTVLSLIAVTASAVGL